MPHSTCFGRFSGVSCAVLFALGCGQAPPAAPPPAPPAVVEAVKAKTEVKTSEPEKAAGKAPDVAKKEPAKRADNPGERLLLFTPAGPLVVQFQFSIDGRPLADVRAELIAQMLALSDSDRDGRTSWSEALSSPYFAGEGRSMSDDSTGKRGSSPASTLERIHDRNHDGFMDLAEAERLAAANDTPAGTFRLESEARTAGADPAQSAAWLLLDTDEDRVLSAEELAAVARLLKSRDADDDDLLEPAELSPSPATLAGATERPATTSVYHGRPKVVQLGPRARWDSLVAALVETYQEDERLVVDKYPLAAPLLAALDKNRDGKLDRDEIRGLNDCPAHATIAVGFGRPASVKVVHAVPAAGPTALGPGKDPLENVIRFSKLDVELRIRDQAAAVDLAALTKTQFAGLDADSSGYLDGDEFAPAFASMQLSFAATDANGDGKIVLDELMVYARRQQTFLQSNPRARPADADEAGWSVLDADSDGRLSLREIRTAAARLGELDRDGDGRVTSAELPRALVVRLERGAEGPRMDAATPPGMARPAGPRAAAGPPWFDRMDSNSDGDVSPREFLGTPGQFEALDADRDGFVSRAEAAVIEGKVTTLKAPKDSHGQ